MSVVHNHSPGVIPFSVAGQSLRPLMQMAAPIGSEIPTWDIRSQFGDRTNLLVTSMEMGRNLATCLGFRTAALMLPRQRRRRPVAARGGMHVSWRGNEPPADAELVAAAVTGHGRH